MNDAATDTATTLELLAMQDGLLPSYTRYSPCRQEFVVCWCLRKEKE